jgi:long-chain acyl-CoA synthetase
VDIEIRGMGDGGKAGEVWLRSAYLFLGYAGANPGGARWQDGWLTVGEMGWMEGGCLSLAGRVDRMVTIADHNVFPEEIEGFLAGLGGIELAAVLPRADPRRGVHLVAMVQGDSGVEAAVMAALRARFGALKAPKALIWRQDWPYLPSGKMDLRALAAEVAV